MWLTVAGNLQECLKVDELKCNPFAARIVALFSEDGSGSLNFQKFINMMSVFSSRASSQTKTVWAFALWDFDGGYTLCDCACQVLHMLVSNNGTGCLCTEHCNVRRVQLPHTSQTKTVWAFAPWDFDGWADSLLLCMPSQLGACSRRAMRGMLSCITNARLDCHTLNLPHTAAC